MAEATRIQERQIMRTPLFREVYKNTWLKLTTTGTKKKERLWIVFCVHDDNEPFLEAYADAKMGIIHKPCWFISMSNTLHITSTICPENNEYEFVITLQTEVIKLSACSWQLMSDWVETLKRKLSEMRILLPKENIYSKLPETKNTPLLSTRDPTSPLPAPPVAGVPLVPGVEPTHVPRANPVPPTPTSHYEQLATNTTSRRAHRSVSDCDRHGTSILQRITTDTLTSSESTSTHRRRSSSLSEIPDDRRITLRVQQVLQLEKEIRHPAGVRLELHQFDCLHGIALINALGSVWVAGWKQREHPMLYNCLHIGDQLLTVQGQAINKSLTAYDLMKQPNLTGTVELVIRRVPLGRVFAIRRETEGQSLGIVQQDGSAVIKHVLPNGLAARHGLPAHTPSCMSPVLTMWALTEVNSRPLNLFFKGTEVADRLNSVGRDISILVQPSDFVKLLKKQLKGLRNYKDYLLQ